MVVSEASATAYCNESVGCPETDHVSIARPTDMQHSTLTSKIKLAMQDACRVGIHTGTFATPVQRVATFKGVVT